jgi:hypothetical protein
MRSIVRKLRGALGTAVTWAVGWAGGGFALAVILVFLIPGLAGIESGTFADLAPVLTIIGGVSGMLGGTAFSIALGTVHRHRQLHELRSARMTLWGALAGLLVPLGVAALNIATGALPLTAEVLGTIVVAFGGGGAATAVATVKLAQAAERQIEGPVLDQALPSGE